MQVSQTSPLYLILIVRIKDSSSDFYEVMSASETKDNSFVSKLSFQRLITLKECFLQNGYVLQTYSF